MEKFTHAVAMFPLNTLRNAPSDFVRNCVASHVPGLLYLREENAGP